MKKQKVRWAALVDDDSYRAATDYLTLLMVRADAIGVVSALKSADLEDFSAIDILQNARMRELSYNHPLVRPSVSVVERGAELRPILLLRTRSGLIIPNGFFRLSAAFHFNPTIRVPCKLVSYW